MFRDPLKLPPGLHGVLGIHFETHWSIGTPLTSSPCSLSLLASLLPNYSVMVRCRGRYYSGRQVS